MNRVTQRVEEWKRKIVDLSRRNRLLYFARTRGSTLKIKEPTLPEVFDRLVNSEKAWEFYMPPDIPEASESGGETTNVPDGAQPSLLSNAETGDSETDDSAPDLDSDELLTDAKDGNRLRSILRNLYRRSRTDFEERGVRILFLTFGVLEWKEVEESEIVKSPILLVPVELRRESVNDPFQLFPVDEEIIINPALVVKLGDDFRIEIPSLPDDRESVPLEKFLKSFEAQVEEYEFKVKQECWLGLFSFHKLVIYHDLKSHAGLLETHGIVRSLCEEEKEPVKVDAPEPRDLDKRTSPDTSFLVADADSSQLVCIETVKSGSNLVIQGPPGTGKSQTITNLISEFIARGKSVLFVSEKMAALEVVFQRLQYANLGHFCLQLHSHRANKREVTQELYKTYTEQLQPKKGLTEFEAKQLLDPNAMGAFDVFDSVLDACAAVMPQRQLKWHYRSEHESLIAFSNCMFYDYSLITFPSWLQEDEALGVKFVHVPDGVYDRGGRRDNVREAEKVVSLVEEHLRRFPNQSLGVVTFNLAQADTIENHFEQFRRQNPDLERYFAPDRFEKFFVKNLESVQGDERDVLIFSTGYGKDKFGRLTMNFGPLNSNGGERRLNVAVTRARKKVIVVSSIRASDFDLGEVNREGVRVLHRYLDFAERGLDALALQGAQGEFESPLEQAVAAKIRSFGFGVVPQVGCSTFRVDLGVVDPSNPGRFVIGVECDGASYHSSATARDRDRIRQQILEKLGWKIHRIWSPDWVTRNETEVNRLKSAIEMALKDRTRNSSVSSSRTSNGPVSSEPPIVVEKEIPNIDERVVIPGWVKTYQVCRPHGSQARWLQFHDPDALPALKRMLSQIIEVEGPVHKDVAATRLAKAWDLDRVGERMMNAIKSAWRSLSRERLLRIQGEFLWPAAESFQAVVRQPNSDDDQSRRSIEEIPQEEIALAMRNLVRDSLSIERDKLLFLVARIFGFERAGNHIQKALANTFDELVESGQLTFIEDRVSLPN